MCYLGSCFLLCVHVCVCVRWALFSTIRHCPLCCGLASVHGCSIRRPCGGLHGNQRARLQWCPLSGPCSGQWCHLGDTKISFCLTLTLTPCVVPSYIILMLLEYIFCTSLVLHSTGIDVLYIALVLHLEVVNTYVHLYCLHILLMYWQQNVTTALPFHIAGSCFQALK